MNAPTPHGGWQYPQPAAPRPPVSWWKRPVTWIAGLLVLVAILVVIVVVLLNDSDKEGTSASGSDASSRTITTQVDSTMFPNVTQAQFEEAVTATCRLFRGRVGDGTPSAQAFASFIRVSSRDVLVQNGWIRHTNSTPFDEATLKNQEVTLELAAFQGPNGPCSGYEDSFNQVAEYLQQLP